MICSLSFNSFEANSTAIENEIDILFEFKQLANIYKEYHSFHSLPLDWKNKVTTYYKDTELFELSLFITELCLKNNDILKDEFINRPDDKLLKNFFVIKELNLFLWQSEEPMNDELVLNYLEKDYLIQECLIEYYHSIFISITNKNRPWNYRNLNFDINNMKFKNRTEQEIFFIIFGIELSDQILSYYQAQNGINYNAIREYVKKLPTVNDKEYFEYKKLRFRDFKINVEKKNILFSEYYLPMFIDNLIAHVLMLKHFELPTKEFINQSLLRRKNTIKKYNSGNFTEEQIEFIYKN